MSDGGLVVTAEAPGCHNRFSASVEGFGGDHSSAFADFEVFGNDHSPLRIVVETPGGDHIPVACALGLESDTATTLLCRLAFDVLRNAAKSGEFPKLRASSTELGKVPPSALGRLPKLIKLTENRLVRSCPDWFLLDRIATPVGGKWTCCIDDELKIS